MATNPFPVENVPFGIISTQDNSLPRPATIIDDVVIDLSILESLGAFSDLPNYPASDNPLSKHSLNAFAALPKDVHQATRARVQSIWRDEQLRVKYSHAFIKADAAINHLPMETINYTDYVSSRGHFENLNKLIGTPEDKKSIFYQMPTGYYGNSRNIAVSGSPVYRFEGVIDGQFQRNHPASTGPSKMFDFELELGFYLRKDSKIGQPIPLDEVDDYVFGFVLLNDWSARDIQRAESGGPTGPFLAKSGCVTISPWIVTLDALSVARLPRTHTPVVGFVDYLRESSAGAPVSENNYGDKPCLDIRCSINWTGDKAIAPPFEVCRSLYGETYWTYRQLLAHQTRNGSAVGVGDLIGTGTMSLFESDDFGRCCLGERTYSGTKPVDIGGGQTRAWIENGDEINLQGWVHDPESGERVFGFGECKGIVVPLPSGDHTN